MNRPSFILVVSLLGVLVVSSCKSYDVRVAEARSRFFRGDYLGSTEELQKLLEDDRENAHLYRLERSLPLLAQGRFQEAEESLSQAKERLDFLSQPLTVESMAALLTDDEAIAYGGEDHEKILVRAVLALVNLMRGGGDAIAYANQLEEKQNEIISYIDEEGATPKSGYQRIAFGAYLAAILFEDQVRFDRARRLFEQVLEWEPGFPLAEEGILRTRGEEKDPPPGFGVVHVIGLVGEGPLKIESSEPISSTALALAQAIYRIVSDRGVIPSGGSIRVPILVGTPDSVDRLSVSVDGSLAGETLVLTDVESVALSQFETTIDQIVARAVARRTIKLVILEGATHHLARKDKRQYSEQEFAVDLLTSAAGFLWTETEKTDTRCWSCLPSSFQVKRLVVPAGEAWIEVAPVLNGRQVAPPSRTRVLVRDGYATFVLAVAPGAISPSLLSSDPGTEEPAR